MATKRHEPRSTAEWSQAREGVDRSYRMATHGVAERLLTSNPTADAMGYTPDGPLGLKLRRSRFFQSIGLVVREGGETFMNSRTIMRSLVAGFSVARLIPNRWIFLEAT